MRYVAFLRAINVGGRTIKMSDLRQHIIDAGFAGVETFIASGNVIFHADEQPRAELAQRIASHLEQRLGYAVATFVRSSAEVAAIAAHPAFSSTDLAEATALNVILHAEPLIPSVTEALFAKRNPIDDFACHEREVYWLCRKKQSESNFSNAVFEKLSGVQGTMRTINTIRTIATKYA